MPCCYDPIHCDYLKTKVYLRSPVDCSDSSRGSLVHCPLYRARQLILITSNHYKWPMYHIYSMLPGGSRMRRITRGFDPACSPDGSQVAFAAPTSDDTEFPSNLFVVTLMDQMKNN